jgi:hypothetical protein
MKRTGSIFPSEDGNNFSSTQPVFIIPQDKITILLRSLSGKLTLQGEMI